MKRNLIAFLMLTSMATADFEVHEWGTFTTLSNSNGMHLSWYSPQSEHSALPKFVRNEPKFMKSNLMSTVRMETPVIYFYPDAPMKVHVEANFKQGNITEFYPADVKLRTTAPLVPMPNGSLSLPTQWIGTLRRPDNAKALAMIPPVSADGRGAHYAAAREVPDAWIFHHQAEVKNHQTDEAIIEDQADKFIFYRGIGNFTTGLNFADTSNHKTLVVNHGTYRHPLGILLEVRDGKSRWSPLPVIPATGEEPTKIPASISGKWQSVEQAETQLSRWFQSTLTSEGLTSAEAAAMIATWNGTWFRESGLRAFTIMPREQIDDILPLAIQPQPDKLVRVFVNRHELISNEQEEELASLVSDLRIPEKDAAARFEKLELGRFRDAAVQRGFELARWRMHDRYHSITRAVKTD